MGIDPHLDLTLTPPADAPPGMYVNNTRNAYRPKWHMYLWWISSVTVVILCTLMDPTEGRMYGDPKHYPDHSKPETLGLYDNRPWHKKVFVI